MSSTSESQEWRTIEGEPRYFRRNASRAMAGSIVRGLVELWTNGRDSAYRMYSAGLLGTEALERTPVEIEYVVSSDRKKWLLVRDQFEGMSADVMRSKLLRYGAAASGFDQGMLVRGINARGAKDVGALGRVKFESIFGDSFSECEVYSGRVRGPTTRPCTTADRDRLGIPIGNGTVVTLEPDAQTSVPSFDSLVQDLDRHVEVRYHPVGMPFVPLRMRERRNRRVGTEREIRGFHPDGTLVLDEAIPLHEWTSYGAGEGRLQIFRSAAQLSPFTSRSSTARLWRNEAGIVVTDGRTAHDISFFFARGSDDVAARYVFGQLHLPQLPELLREFDRIEVRRDAGEPVQFSELNPNQVTDPDRLGLNREHPFVIAVEDRVRPLVEEVLRQIQDELAPSAQERLGSDLRSALEKLGEKLAERLDVASTTTARGDHVRWGLSVLPAGVRLELGNPRKTTRRVTVYYRVEPTTAPDAVECGVSTESPSIQVSAGQITLSPVEGQPGVLRGSFEVSAIALTDVVPVLILAEGKSTVLKVSVREPSRLELDKDLQFSQRSYSALPGRRKRIEVLADASLADRDVVVSLALDAIALSDSSVRLDYDAERGVASAVLYADSAGPAADRVIAKCGDLVDEATVAFEDFNQRPKIDFNFTDAESFSGRRFRWDPQDNNRVLIAGGHPTVARVLGPKQLSTGDTWPGQSAPQTRAILAELIADAFAYRRLQQEVSMMGIETDNLVDPVDYENRRYQIFEDVFLVCHEALTPAYESVS